MKKDKSLSESLATILRSRESNHRVGAHSDDYGGDSDYPCYCEANDLAAQQVLDLVSGLLPKEKVLNKEKQYPYEQRATAKPKPPSPLSLSL